MKEIWKAIDGYNGMYEVSNLGRVRSFHESIKSPEVPRILVQGRNKAGYMFVNLPRLDREGRYCPFVHALVAKTFICQRPWDGQDWTVNHKDYDKGNNVLKNLEWMPHADNIRHSSKVIPRNRGEANHSKLTEAQVRDMRIRWDSRQASTPELAREYGVSANTVWMIVKRKKWAHVK